MKTLVLSVMLLFALNIPLFSAESKIAPYVSYDPLLRVRAGINYGAYGLYVRAVFDKEYSYSDYYNYPNLKGAYLGFNYNRNLFEYKRLECILNAFLGTGLFRVEYDYPGELTTSWKQTVEFGLAPEIRFFKRASVTISPMLYQYHWMKDVNGNNMEYGRLMIQTISLNNLTLGFKFYL